MDRNSVIGFILIAAIFIGFTVFQSNQARKRAELQAQLENDSYQATFEAWMAEANTVYQEDGAAMHDGTYTTAPAIAVTAEPAE